MTNRVSLRLDDVEPKGKEMEMDADADEDEAEEKEIVPAKPGLVTPISIVSISHSSKYSRHRI